MFEDSDDEGDGETRTPQEMRRIQIALLSLLKASSLTYLIEKMQLVGKS